jgi:hypothetical protein
MAALALTADSLFYFQDAMAEAKLLEHNHSQLSSPTTQPITTTTTMIQHALPALSEDDKETSSV